MGEVSMEMIHKTQKSLGKYVKKPALTDKLLKKPPFRFLHDVVKEVIKENGFLKGLFSEEELNSENVKEKNAKVAFLAKLIDATKAVSNTDLKARPSKIVAGLEPAETNVLLQTIAKVLDSKQDTQDYVTKFQSGELKNNNAKKSVGSDDKKDLAKKTTLKSSLNKVEEKTNNDVKKDKISRKTSKEKSKPIESTVTRVKKSSGSLETPKSSERLVRDSSRGQANKKTDERPIDKSKDESRKKTKNEEKESKNNEKTKEEVLLIRESGVQEPENIERDELKTVETQPSQQNGELQDKTHLETTSGGNALTEIDQKILENEERLLEKAENVTRQNSAGLVRPKSARPKSGRDRERRDSAKDANDGAEKRGLVELKITAPSSSTRPKSSLLRPPSVRPSSARPGAPRLRPDSAVRANEPVLMGNINVIVENFDPSAGDEEETVLIQNTSEMVEDEGPTTEDLLNMSTDNKGQLVEQILEQIQETGEGDGAKKMVDIDWEQDGLRGKDATTKEVTQLRALIQNLTKTANPLGKLMNYLHEDLDAMHVELQTWTNAKRQLYVEIENQKKINAETAKPLLAKLERLKKDVKKVEEEISTSRSNILRNDKRIAELVNKK